MFCIWIFLFEVCEIYLVMNLVSLLTTAPKESEIFFRTSGNRRMYTYIKCIRFGYIFKKNLRSSYLNGCKGGKETMTRWTRSVLFIIFLLMPLTWTQGGAPTETNKPLNQRLRRLNQLLCLAFNILSSNIILHVSVYVFLHS